tara:strand:+ start:3126 stop:4262 length:1137 start_codon:yes stop_codon:yes gene_type:complete
MASDENGHIPASALTTQSGLTNWILKKNSRFNVFGKKSTFQARVLTEPEPMTLEDVASVRAGGDLSVYKHICLVRIIDPSMAHERFIPDPCSVSVASNVVLATHLQSLHTKMIIPPQYGQGMPEEGDVVDIVLEPSGHGNAPYDLQIGKFLKLTNRPVAPQGASLVEQCSSLESKFEGANGIANLIDIAPSVIEDPEKLKAIQSWWDAIKKFLPEGTVISSSGRTVLKGRQMIYNFAIKRGIANTGDLSDPNEVERVRKILTNSPHNMNIAIPEYSNHCVGAGCKETGKIAIDLSGVPISSISMGLRQFKESPSSDGYKALLNSGVLPGSFVTDGFVSSQRYNAGGGWREEPSNNAVHMEFFYTSSKPTQPGNSGADL